MIGETVSHYKILEKLGEGGMGVVYKAEDTRLKRPVVLKFLPKELSRDEETMGRFIHEAQTASALDHPNICNIHEIDETEDGQIFMCMAFYEGESLKDKLARERIPLDKAMDIAVQIMQGLVKAHEKGIVHRDIKPANIMITQDGTAKIVDFGIAKIVTETTVTTAGTIIGTMSYMSPEQVKGETVDLRADIWSVGVILYEMITGRRPFSGEYHQAVLYSIVNEKQAPMREQVDDLPGEVEKIVEKCLKKEPRDRYQNGLELLDSLARIGARSTLTTGIEGSPQHSSKRRIWKIGPAAMIIAALMLVLFTTPAGNVLKRWMGFRVMPVEKHLAILPFTVIGGDADANDLGNGLLYTLIGKLNQIMQHYEKLWIVPADEVYKYGITSPSDVVRAFRKVPLTITGSLQFDGDNVRLTLNLVDNMKMRVMKSLVQNYQAASLFGLQDDIVLQVIEMLNEELKPQVESLLSDGGTTVSMAYDFYLRGYGCLMQYQQKDNIDKAIDLFHKALERDSSYALAYAGLGEACWRKYDAEKTVEWVDRAVGYCGRALQLNDRIAPVYITLGLLKSGTGHYEEALQNFRTALQFEPANANALREMAKTYKTMGEDDLAEVTYKSAIRLQPEYWGNYNSLGIFYYEHGRYQDAIREFKQVVSLTPANTRGLNNLGSMFFSLGRYSEAIKTFERSAAIDSNYIAYSNLGTLYFFIERYRDSAAMFELALDILHDDYQVWGNLAASYDQIPGKKQQAAESYQRAISLAELALEVNPNDLELLADLANYHSMLDHKNRAEALLLEIISKNPTATSIVFTIGMTYEKLGKRAEALEWIIKAIDKGYSVENIQHIPDLKALRRDERFRQYLSKLK